MPEGLPEGVLAEVLAVPVELLEGVLVLLHEAGFVPLLEGVEDAARRQGSKTPPTMTAAGKIACPNSARPQQVTAPTADRAQA